MGLTAAHSEPVPRATPIAGAVIARKSGEQVSFIDISGWRFVDVNQNLRTGDELRTNAVGQLAVLFADKTQVRLGRNTTMLVKQMGTAGETILDLKSGTIWARAQRGGQGLTVDTPAAAAAIRGTDWSLSVEGDKTSLVVMEGTVELANELGSVQVSQGEAAVARIGQAPQKVIIVNSDDREQMLFYLSLRDAFTFMPASPLHSPDMRRAIDHIDAKPEASRTAEDWLTLAEAQLSLEGRQRAQASLARARSMKLTRAQQARVDLIEALIAGSERRYADAARLFAKARPGLDPKRRSVADYGGFFARALVDPNRLEKAPRHVTGPNGAFSQAYAAGFLENIRAALDIIKQAEKDYPDDPSLPAYRAFFSLFLNDREQMKEAMDRSLALDPTNPYALQARARYRGDIEGNVDAAIADVETALTVAPGSTNLWNDLGLAQSVRGDMQSAEAALKKAIELDPQSVISHANLAYLYLEQNRIREAKREIDFVLAEDPGFDLALIALGRYHLQTGELDKAAENLLAGTVANPAYSQGQLLLAVALQELGNKEAAEQAVDNADRLDPNDPVIPSFRAAVAIDEYDAVGAIAAAQEYMRRLRARGGKYGSISFNHDAGSTLNNAFRLQGLNDWGQYYGDITFDPFTGSAYVDQTLHGSVNPFRNGYLYGTNDIAATQNESTFSSFMQGLLYDPHMISGPTARPYYLRYPFIEAELGIGLATYNGDSQPIYSGSVQSFSNLPFPVSTYLSLDWVKTPLSGETTYLPGSFDGDAKVVSGVGYVTATPTPDDRFVAYGQHNDSTLDLTSNFVDLAALTFDRDDNIKSTNAGLGWSHTFSFENVLNAAFFYGNSEGQDLRTVSAGNVSLDDLIDAEQTSYIGALNHTVATGDVTWRYGLEGGVIDVETERTGFGKIETSVDYGRLYVDALHDISTSLTAEYGLFGTYAKGDFVDTKQVDPRVGVAYAPVDGQWLRAAYIAQSYDFDLNTLAPVTTVGIQPNQLGLATGGSSDTLAFRWDAEWTDWLFTAVDYQHQDVNDFGISYSELWPVTLFPESVLLSDGRIDRVSLSSNVLIGNGFGLSGIVAYADSENKDRSSFDYGESLPFVPEWAGQVALTWVNEANIKATVAGNYIGTRAGSLTSIDGFLPIIRTELDAFWTLDANVTWEPFDKRFELSLAAFNLLDEDFDIATGIPGWGRSFKGMVKVRF